MHIAILLILIASIVLICKALWIKAYVKCNVNVWRKCNNLILIFLLQIEDVAEGAVKPPPNKIPIFFFGTHETYVSLCFNEHQVINNDKWMHISCFDLCALPHCFLFILFINVD